MPFQDLLKGLLDRQILVGSGQQDVDSGQAQAPGIKVLQTFFHTSKEPAAAVTTGLGSLGAPLPTPPAPTLFSEESKPSSKPKELSSHHRGPD